MFRCWLRAHLACSREARAHAARPAVGQADHGEVELDLRQRPAALRPGHVHAVALPGHALAFVAPGGECRNDVELGTRRNGRACDAGVDDDPGGTCAERADRVRGRVGRVVRGAEDRRGRHQRGHDRQHDAGRAVGGREQALQHVDAARLGRRCAALTCGIDGVGRERPGVIGHAAMPQEAARGSRGLSDSHRK